jgi:sugar/nucleoside kinase (ribokinase family)
VGFGLNSVDLLAVLDTFPRQNGKQPIKAFARLPGGQAATAMVACARQGWRTRYVGRFGGDEHGRLGMESLRLEGVDLTGSTVVPEATNQFAVILVDASTGDRTVLWHRDARLRRTPADVPEEAVTAGRVLLVDCHETEAATAAARSARAAGLPTVIDVEKVRPGIEDLLSVIDVIIAAQEFPSQLTGEVDLGRALAVMANQFGAALVCVTLGASGSLALVQGREIRTPGFKVEAVDSTGAGDVFRGGFIAGWLAAPEGDVEHILRVANATAALKCRALGARTAIPGRAEVESLLA